MNLYILKILGIFIVTLCCIIATYSDVKRQIIPNKLTFSTLTVGITLVSFYFYQNNSFNPFYYISIIIVFILSYLLWHLGVWAGGDVKLFTAISSLFVPEFLDIIPYYSLFNLTMPYELFSVRIPTFLLMFNSVLSIVPLILAIVLYIIIKEKHHLINSIMNTFNIKSTLSSYNSLIISYVIISQMNVHYTILKVIFLIFLLCIISQIMKYDVILIILSVAIISHQLFMANITVYLEGFLTFSVILIIKDIYKEGIIKEALTDNKEKSILEEGMILAYPLYYNDGYYFDKSSTISKINDMLTKKDKGKLVCGIKSAGLTDEDILTINQIDDIMEVPIKKGFPFAPFILIGLIITFSVGNTFSLITMMLEWI